MYPLAYLQHMSVHRVMVWDLSKCISGMSHDKLGANEAYPAGHGKDVFGLYSRLVRAEYPTGETPPLATTFINQFLKVRGDFFTDFRPLGWVHSTDKSWWGRMVGFVLTELGDLLKQVGLYHAVRAVQYGLPQSSHHFYSVLERYNSLTGTFFTPVREMKLALHELYEISGLVIGDLPYEEYVPTIEELYLLKKEDPQVYRTYWKVLCHFHICGHTIVWRNKGVKQMY